MKDYLTEAFVQMRERLLSTSRRYLKDAAASEDALQEAFVKLWGRYLPASEREAGAILQRTVRNTSVDMLRRQKTVPLGEKIQEDREENQGETQEREVLFLKIEELVRKDLSDVQQYIIRRHEYEGASLETVAQELGMRASAVRMQLSRARNSIRKKYHEQELL